MQSTGNTMIGISTKNKVAGKTVVKSIAQGIVTTNQSVWGETGIRASKNYSDFSVVGRTLWSNNTLTMWSMNQNVNGNYAIVSVPDHRTGDVYAFWLE
jgi:hypothetical protein